MSNPTDTNQASEDELRAEILTEFKQVHKLAPADYTENCTNIVMSIIRSEKQKLLAEMRELIVDKPTGNYNADSLLERDVLIYNQATAYLRTKLAEWLKESV